MTTKKKNPVSIGAGGKKGLPPKGLKKILLTSEFSVTALNVRRQQTIFS
jgi:hypothetical protein